MLNLDYRDARPIYLQICDGLREQIRTGVLQTGDRLPSVRELATQLTINPNTIQRSYHQLEADGWIASVPGKGSFVCGVPIGEEADKKALWDELTALQQRMARLGIRTEEIVTYLTQGGNCDA